jgi:tetratricopeptide (TPR) repeat protein
MKKIVCSISFLILVLFLPYFAFPADEVSIKDQIESNRKIIAESTEKIAADKNEIDSFYVRGAAHFHLGQIYIMLYAPGYTKEQNKLIKDEFEAAVEDFTTLIHKKPEFLQGYVMRGMTYGQLGMSITAIADFTQAIEIDPKNSFAYYARGREYWALKDYKKAKEDYDMAVKLDVQWKDNFYH